MAAATRREQLPYGSARSRLHGDKIVAFQICDPARAPAPGEIVLARVEVRRRLEQLARNEVTAVDRDGAHRDIEALGEYVDAAIGEVDVELHVGIGGEIGR